MIRKILCFALAASVISISGCKKDSDDNVEVKPSLYGVAFKIAPYGAVGDSFELTSGGTIHASDGSVVNPSDIDYYWTVNSGDKITSKNYTFVPEEIGDYTITLYAFSVSSTYYTSSVSHVISIIDPALEKSLSGTGINAEDEHISSDGVDYYYKRIAGLDWFRNNLAAPVSGICYSDAPVTATVFGKYYSWDEANAACPEGWRLPTAAEWESLAEEYEGKAGALMADAWFNGSRLWAYKPEVGINNASGFSAIPSGYVSINGSARNYAGLKEYAMFWSSTPSEKNPDMATCFYFNVNQPEIFTHDADKQSLALSVRCVR